MSESEQQRIESLLYDELGFCFKRQNSAVTVIIFKPEHKVESLVPSGRDYTAHFLMDKAWDKLIELRAELERVTRELESCKIGYASESRYANEYQQKFFAERERAEAAEGELERVTRELEDANVIARGRLLGQEKRERARLDAIARAEAAESALRERERDMNKAIEILDLVVATRLPEECPHGLEPDICDSCRYALELKQAEVWRKTREFLEPLQQSQRGSR